MDKNKHFSEIKSQRIGDCFLRITPNTKHESRNPRMPISICMHWADVKKDFYKDLPYKCTRDEFEIIAKSNGRGRQGNNETSPYLLKQNLIKEFDKICEQLRGAHQASRLSFDLAVSVITGKSADSFLSLWERIAREKKVTTMNSYLYARKSFRTIVGDVTGFNIDKALVRKWEEGLISQNVSSTTIGIYMRSFKVIWNMAKELGYLADKEYPFGKHEGQIKIPPGRNRKRYYLSIQQMDSLYDLFLSKKYPPEWPEIKRRNIHESLGLFLASYLCNGFNLADAAELRYDTYYYQTGGKAFSFVRKKTEDRSKVEVIIPIIPQLQAILKEIALAPKHNALVFPQIIGDADNEEKKVGRIRDTNGYIRKRMKSVAEVIGLNICPTNTWARHSFATNLSHSHVPEKYISESMGHSVSSDSITERYIDKYPLETQFQFNSRLLSDGNQEKDKVEISRQEYEEFLRYKEACGK